MPTSLRQAIENDLSGAIFNAPEWAEPIILYPGGNQGSPQTIAGAFVDRRREEGTNEVNGDGATPDSAEGRRVRQTYLVDLPNSVTITEKSDTMLIDGTLFSVIRVIGRDSSPGASQTVRVVSVDRQFTRQPNLRPTTNWRERSKNG